MAEPSPTREQAEAMRKHAREVLDLLADQDAFREKRVNVQRLAHDVVDLVAAVSRLEAERDELLRERAAQEKVVAACARLLGDSMPHWAPLPVREIGCEACAAAEAQVEALVGRERELTRALEGIAAEAESWGGVGTGKALARIAELAREALAGGGRTPPRTTDSGGLGLSAEPVAEAGDPIDTAEARVARALTGDEWETRDDYPDGEGKCWVERGTTGAGTWERFTETPLTYVEACAIERLLEIARALTTEPALKRANQDSDSAAQVREQPQEDETC